MIVFLTKEVNICFFLYKNVQVSEQSCMNLFSHSRQEIFLFQWFYNPVKCSMNNLEKDSFSGDISIPYFFFFF